MTKADLVAFVAEKTKTSKKDSEMFLNTICDSIEHFLSKKETVRILGFGTFSPQFRKASTARNPKTGEPVNVPETWVPRFKPGTALKEAVKGIKGRK